MREIAPERVFETVPLSDTGAPLPAEGTSGLPNHQPRLRARRHPLLSVIRTCALYALVLAGIAVAVGPVGPSVNAYLAAAASARAAYRYDRALAWYSAAATQAPDDPRPRCRAGDVYMLQQEWRLAVEAYQSCSAVAPGDASAWLSLGDALDALDASGEATRAENAWQRAASDGSLTAHRRLGLLDERLQRFPEALREWSLLPPNDPQALEHIGLLALWRGDAQTAAASFVAARAIPNQYADQVVDGGFVLFAARPEAGPFGLGKLGYLFLSAGMPSFAVAPLRQAIAQDPELGDAHAYLGWALWQLGDLAAARPEIAQGLRLAPTLSFAYYASAQVAAADGKTSQALALAEQGLELDARNPALWSLDGTLALAEHQYPQAEVSLDNAAQLSNDPAYTIAALHLYADHGLGYATGRAHTATIAALERFPSNSEVVALVSQVDAGLGYATVAYYTAVQAQALDPSNPDPYMLLARYSLNQGDYVAAALDLRTALALRPHGPLAAQARAMLAPLGSDGA